MRKSRSRSDGYATGYNHGFNAGHDKGYTRGHLEGISKTLFEGTSIIIPTFNQVEYLKECIESIRRYTPQPYELIIIDNASDDGSAEYLKSVTGIRFKILSDNRGFAGAVNQGLMMARGTTLLILNNDSVVTSNWLGNLLRCLLSDTRIGIVGPVTNYISGDQLIDTHYTGMSEMQQFAEGYNQTDPQHWVTTERLTGFCMLLRRETFLSLGYFDEGFEVGNCEDDDYGLRARLMGLQLIIAKDTFIHHYGSVSMKSLSGRFDQVYGKNLLFYSNKWADPHRYLSLDWQKANQLSTQDFYPTCVIVQGVGTSTYWVENNSRYPISGDCGKQAIRISQVDLRGWQLAHVISSEEVQQRSHDLQHYSSESGMSEGNLVKVDDESIYQCKSGKLHRFINNQALAAWNIDTYTILQHQNHQHIKPEGPPIICPPVIRADNI